MGSFMPYKNVETLALALHVLPGYRLHLLSKIGRADRHRLLELAPPGALMVHNGVSDAEYAELLDDAFALVHASLDEGFGIPLIEAMAAGTPIVVSDIPIFREVGADAARYFPAEDPDAAAAAIRALENRETWNGLSALGRRVAAALRLEFVRRRTSAGSRASGGDSRRVPSARSSATDREDLGAREARQFGGIDREHGRRAAGRGPHHREVEQRLVEDGA